MPVLQFIFAFGVEELISAIVIRVGHEDFCQAVQVAVVGRAGVHEFLRGADAMFLEHDDEHLGVHDRAGVEKLHLGKLTTDAHGCTRIFHNEIGTFTFKVSAHGASAGIIVG